MYLLFTGIVYNLSQILGVVPDSQILKLVLWSVFYLKEKREVCVTFLLLRRAVLRSYFYK